ncbi:MAG: hypothetical protein FIA97_10385 [Methylococcaceae bacterium]|nr:hypothetical protein [Methylococcaceae bacterium]
MKIDNKNVAVAMMWSLLATAGSAQAQVLLKDVSEIAGEWVLESVAPALEKPRVPENRVWEFRSDGTLKTSGFNRHFNRDDVQQFTFKVADGIIKADNPGRPGRTTDYKVYEKTNDSMILQGGLEGFYFFKKK